MPQRPNSKMGIPARATMRIELVNISRHSEESLTDTNTGSFVLSGDDITKRAKTVLRSKGEKNRLTVFMYKA